MHNSPVPDAKPPRHYTTLTFHFIVKRVVPAAVERAASLVREKYCSVRHSFHRDISFATTFELHP